MKRWKNVNGIYQIYPRSFKDSNGDGVGDLAGITEKLDYIKGKEPSLGIDAVWISPFYRSPMADFGYDIADYYSVDPLFGDLEDFKHLLKEAHRRGIKVMVDYVPNHTSSEHPWFIASKSSRMNEKREWYVWRDPKPDGSPPNNWLSVFGGSAWQFDDATGQYYLHSFLAAQPDLNWDNPEVRQAMGEVLDFWLSLGVDGIRADAVRWISKNQELLDNLPNPEYKQGDDPYHQQLQHNSRYGAHLFGYLKEMVAVVEKYEDRIILFEDYLDRHFDSLDQYKNFYAVNASVAAPFNFEGMNAPYDAAYFRDYIHKFQTMAGSTLRPFYCFGNHDKPRLASRFGSEQARLIGMLQLALPGTPVIYYGDELGMKNGTILPADIQDPFESRIPGLGLGRDPGRTPMQWSTEKYAGFSVAEPWLPINADYEKVNVASEAGDFKSSFSMYKKLLELRRMSVFMQGTYKDWEDSTGDIFGFERRHDDETLLVLLNMSSNENEIAVQGELVFSTHPIVGKVTKLLPHQGIILRK